MKTSTSIAELLNGGLRFEADEAVAIAQQLIDRLRHANDAGDVQPPYGPPAPANVFLNADGSIRCVGCDTPPTVSEVAIFLDVLLPAGSPRVPGGLRYAIARGMLDVDVPPFDSLDDFAGALARYEQGARDAAVRAVLARGDGLCTALVRPPAFDRRVARATTADLRRELRNADARLYQQQIARATAMMSASSIATALPVPPQRSRTPSAIAACLGAGLLLIGAGELMHSERWTGSANTPSDAVVQPRLPVAPVLDEAAPLPPVAPMVAEPLAPRALSVSTRRVEDSRGLGRAFTPRPVSSRGVGKPSTRSAAAAVNRVRAQRQSTGVMDRLRLGWLRNAFKTSL
jgi:hypothetical protein